MYQPLVAMRQLFIWLGLEYDSVFIAVVMNRDVHLTLILQIDIIGFPGLALATTPQEVYEARGITYSRQSRERRLDL